MGRGFLSLIALLAFALVAAQAMAIYTNQAKAIALHEQELIAQTSLTIQEQDYEESLWRTVGLAGNDDHAICLALGECAIKADLHKGGGWIATITQSKTIQLSAGGRFSEYTLPNGTNHVYH